MWANHVISMMRMLLRCLRTTELSACSLSSLEIPFSHSLSFFWWPYTETKRERERRWRGGAPFIFFGPLIDGLTPAGPLLSRRPIWLLRPLLSLSLSRSPERIHARRTRRWRRACCYFWFRRSNSTFDVGAIRERLIRVYRTALADPEGEPIGFTKHHLLLLVSSPTLSLALLL